MNTDKIVALIKAEMKPSMGCTEPVAVGLAVSKTCVYLTKPATHLKLFISSNIFKNAYSVKIPNACKPGIPLAATLGFLLSKPENTMEIFADVNNALVEQAETLIANGFTEIEVLEDSRFYIEVIANNEDETVRTITLDSHENMVKVIKNDEVIKSQEQQNQAEDKEFDITSHTIKDLVKIAECIELDKIRFLTEAIDMNYKAADEGFKGDYGLRIGKTIKQQIDDGLFQLDLMYYVKMVVAAACDCRMGGGQLSAMTVLGSGNQGFETILPVAATAKYLHLEEEKTLRAVMMSILITIYIKYHVGRLSPICGATLSGAAASGAIAWLMGGNIDQIEGAIQNMLGNLSGMICDGAKEGCSLKLSNCAGEAVLSAKLSTNNRIIQHTDGIISSNVEDTIRNVAALSKIGMSKVDMNIIDIMQQKQPV